jgi:hypothetical protein
MKNNQEGWREQSAVFSFLNIRRRTKTAGGGGVTVSLRAALIASLAAALAFAGCKVGDSGNDVIENPPADSIIIYPAKTEVENGNSRKFYVLPSGNSKVDWTIIGKKSSYTRIDPNGGLQIAQDETAKTITVVAKLKADWTKKSTATVTIKPLAIPYKEANSFSNAANGGSDSAIDLIKAAAAANSKLARIKLTQDAETVDLGDSDTDISGGLVLDDTTSPATVEIDGMGRTVQLDTNSANGSVITVGAGVKLTLRNITFVGKTGNDAALIRVKDGGQLILEDEAKITGNTNDGSGSYSGGGYSESSAPGSGGGVVVHNGGVLTMTGQSEISGNTAGAGGGVIVYTDGILTMTGGFIKENTAKNGGGVFIADGSSLTMSENAAISGNGVGVGSGGGILLVDAASAVTMTGGKISENTASGGGGIYIKSGSFTMSGDAAISGNEAGSGGGVSGGGSFTMSGKARISGNKAVNGGGGVAIGGMNFTMNGGVISGNKAKKGGGVSASGGSNNQFHMNFGTIYGSDANGQDADGYDLKNTAGNGAAVAISSGATSNLAGVTTDKTIVDGVEQ